MTPLVAANNREIYIPHVWQTDSIAISLLHASTAVLMCDINMQQSLIQSHFRFKKIISVFVYCAINHFSYPVSLVNISIIFIFYSLNIFLFCSGSG